MRISDWSSDVCSSDLLRIAGPLGLSQLGRRQRPLGTGRTQRPVLQAVQQVVAQRACEVVGVGADVGDAPAGDGARQALDVRSEEHTSELQSLMRISYAVFCLNNKTQNRPANTPNKTS